MPEDTPEDNLEQTVAYIKTHSYRQAKTKFHIGYKVWRRIQDGAADVWLPARGGRGLPEAALQAILQSVQSAPQLSTCARAKLLGFRTETVQTVLTRQGLSRLNARLTFAGYKVETNKPLAVARQRRILALAPGCYTCCDFKTFGALDPTAVDRRLVGPSKIPIRGCILIDQFTGFGWCTLAPEATGAAAAAALEAYLRRVPWKTKGLLLSDNALSFTSREFIEACRAAKLIQRTTRYNHPWSNGKAEAFNKVLKYEAFPAICAGNIASISELQGLLDVWLGHYNGVRSHGGWINRGLPPLAVWDLWSKTTGSPLDKLINMGLIKPAELPRVRVMGCTDPSGGPLGPEHHDTKGLPYAFVIECESSFTPSSRGPDSVQWYTPGSKSNVSLER